jgi:flagellar protein FliL
MSAAATAPADAADAAPKKGKKKLIIILAVVLLLVLGGGGAAFFMMKKKADAEAAAEEGDDGHAKPAAKAAPKAKKKDDHAAPVFVPLDPFTVNLADRDAERYAQIGVTLEIDDPKTGDQLKAYMPAIRNNILMVLSHKTSAQLLEREGKLKLAREIRREAVRAMGIEVEDDEEDEEAAPADGHGAAADAAPKKKKKKKAAPEYLPITAVQFSNFIIQ